MGKTTVVRQLLEGYSKPSFYCSADEAVAVSEDWIEQQWQRANDISPSCLLVIDEIQKASNWSSEIKRLWDAQMGQKSKIKLVLLGSSSLQIQNGLSESLTGRFELIRAYHWGLDETQQLRSMSVQDYLKFGGYPGSYKFLKDKDRFFEFIQSSIINTVVEKDLLTQGRVRNPGLFRQTFQLLRGLPATEVSYTKLLSQLQDKGNTDLVKNYLDLFEGAFLLTQIHKFGRSHLQTKISSPKLILMAPVLFLNERKSSTEFLGLCFEALVGADLIRSGLKPSYWRDGDYEVDFVVEINGETIGVEVKSQKRKSSKSVFEFKKNFEESKIVYIHFENYSKFAENPRKFLTSRGTK